MDYLLIRSIITVNGLHPESIFGGKYLVANVRKIKSFKLEISAIVGVDKYV